MGEKRVASGGVAVARERAVRRYVGAGRKAGGARLSRRQPEAAHRAVFAMRAIGDVGGNERCVDVLLHDARLAEIAAHRDDASQKIAIATSADLQARESPGCSLQLSKRTANSYSPVQRFAAVAIAADSSPHRSPAASTRNRSA